MSKKGQPLGQVQTWAVRSMNLYERLIGLDCDGSRSMEGDMMLALYCKQVLGCVSFSHSHMEFGIL